MTESILLERFRMESDLATQATGEASVADDFVQFCRELPVHARQAQDALWRLVMEGKVTDFQQHGESLLKTLEGAIKAVSVAAWREQLRDVLADLEEVRQEHLSRWPWFSQEDVERAKAEASRGETSDMEDALARIAGVSREEWDRKVDTYEQQKRTAGRQ